VLIADDHPVVRQGLRSFLQLQPDLEIVAEAADGEEAVTRAGDLLPDVVLLDLLMPRVSGIQAIRRIRSASPNTRIIVLTSYADDSKVVPAVRAGAAAYLLKDAEPHELADAIRAVHRGEGLLHPAVTARVLQEVAKGSRSRLREILTERELDVLRLVAQGRSNREIARDLVISEKTVKTHVSNLLAKLHVADRTQAALFAVREGLTDEEGEIGP
jgi:two-component system, NarL family, response regulator LiaR